MKDRAAPRAKPRDRKKAMMLPAVSASWGRTFLQTNKRYCQAFKWCGAPLHCSTDQQEAVKHTKSSNISSKEGKRTADSDKHVIEQKRTKTTLTTFCVQKAEICVFNVSWSSYLMNLRLFILRTISFVYIENKIGDKMHSLGPPVQDRNSLTWILWGRWHSNSFIQLNPRADQKDETAECLHSQ